VCVRVCVQGMCFSPPVSNLGNAKSNNYTDFLLNRDANSG
jgi:hypothetical protein